MEKGSFELDDDSMKGWQIIWNGYDCKKEHGVAILYAPYVAMDEYQEHLKGRIISTTVIIKGMHLALLNSYAATDKASESSKLLFYRCLTKAKKKSQQKLFQIQTDNFRSCQCHYLFKE